MKKKTVISIVFLSVMMSFCGTGYIANSKVLATDENKKIYNVILQYKKGIETRNIDLIIPLISRKYYENGSTTQTEEDDYGYDELVGKVLPEILNNVKAIQYRIRLIDIKIIGNRAKVIYEYWANFLYSVGDKEGWHSKNDFNEIELVKENNKWKIIKGI